MSKRRTAGSLRRAVAVTTAPGESGAAAPGADGEMLRRRWGPGGEDYETMKEEASQA